MGDKAWYTQGKAYNCGNMPVLAIPCIIDIISVLTSPLLFCM